jgi:uncharacterized protein YbjT (DUF2867 family)
MSERPGPILVAGARGNQGGAVVRHLLEQGWKVLALTRRPDSDKSRTLKDLGAELVHGDYDDPRSLVRALEGVHCVYMPGFQASARNQLEKETRYGMSFLQSMKDADVTHLVYASEAGQGADTGLGFLQSKRRIEALIHELRLPATILRHGFYVDWLASPVGSMIWKGLLRGKKDQPFQVICLDDAAALAALAFSDPAGFLGKDIDIAGDEVTPEELFRAWEKVWGKPPKSAAVPLWLLRGMGDFGRFATRSPALSSHADIASLRAAWPSLRKAEDALRAARPMQYPPK